MIARAILTLLLAGSAVGCDFLAPVVTTFPGTSTFDDPCDLPPACDALGAPPPPVESLASILTPDDVCGPGGRQLRAIHLSDDLSIDVDELFCVDLDVEIDGGGPGARVLTLRGDALTRARIHVHSAGLLTEIHVEADHIDASELSLDGPIAATFDDVQTVASRIVLEADGPLAPSQLVVEGGALSDVTIVGARAAVRLQTAYVRRATFAVDSLVIERGRVAEVAIDVRLLEMLDAELRMADVRVDRLVAATGLLHTVHIARCREITLSQLVLTRSFVARCDEPIDVRDVAIDLSTVAADVVGRGGGIRHSVFGGLRAEIMLGEITDSALCGTEAVDVSALACIRCDPGAPPDLCAVVSPHEAFCPGLCASTCMLTGVPPLTAEQCVP